jgi:protein-L-isoaspartate(D-aspartate) O-methyltransferase
VKKDENYIPNETFNRIVFFVAMKKIPDIYFDKLSENGIILAPIIELDNYHILTRYHKKNGKVLSETIEQCLFVSMSDIMLST